MNSAMAIALIYAPSEGKEEGAEGISHEGKQANKIDG